MDKQKHCLREILTAAVFIVIVGVLFVLNNAIPTPPVLVAERRVPAKFPEFTMRAISSGTFMNKFDDYASDHFSFRDTFRGINAFITLDVYQMSDKSGLYRSKNVGVGEFKRTDATSFRQTAERVKSAAATLEGKDMNIYYSIVPDKSTFAEKYMPGFDLGLAESILSDVLGGYKYISIDSALGAGSFYKTDLHWNQAKISDVAARLLSEMGTGAVPGENPVESAGEFRGVYAGQLALPVAADTMSYVDVPGLEVSYLSEKTLQFESGPIYDTGRFNGVDPYDLFLRGPQPLIVIENKEATVQRELYLFRDSFGSSLAPLLASGYSKITLIDLRYINLALLPQFVDFVPGSDVLFIYGSQIFNNPSILQTR